MSPPARIARNGCAVRLAGGDRKPRKGQHEPGGESAGPGREAAGRWRHMQTGWWKRARCRGPAPSAQERKTLLQVVVRATLRRSRPKSFFSSEGVHDAVRFTYDSTSP